MEQQSTENNQRAILNWVSDGSRNLEVPETVITIRDRETSDSNAESTGPAPNESEAGQLEHGGDKGSSCVIEVKGEEFVAENQRICRICHLNAKESGRNELMELDCGCKGELAVAHYHCAEAWFRVRGNRICEICGETAKNVTGSDDNGFLEEWNERSTDNGTTTPDSNRRCLRGQPLCNFLMACLVVAFVLPWFFRVNMF